MLALFGNVFSLAWMLGYTLEKLMDYDPCTVASLITLSFTSCKIISIWKRQKNTLGSFFFTLLKYPSLVTLFRRIGPKGFEQHGQDVLMDRSETTKNLT